MADYLGVSQKWFNAYKNEEEPRKMFSIGNESSVLLYRIQMRINPLENEQKQRDDDFLKALEKLHNPTKVDRLTAEQYWADASQDAVMKARHLLKGEWEVTKGLPIFDWPWKRREKIGR